jgi:hypothetical protein
MARTKREPIERFNEKYIVDEKTGCWNWIACFEKSGYAHFTDKDGKPCRAHRFSYEYFVGPLNSNLEICHSCNNKGCVNPNHLRQDTKSSNTIDKIYQKNHCNQVLSVEEVIEIKKAQKNYYRGQNNDLSHFYKVSDRAISDIKTGKRWAHISIT